MYPGPRVGSPPKSAGNALRRATRVPERRAEA